MNKTAMVLWYALTNNMKTCGIVSYNDEMAKEKSRYLFKLYNDVPKDLREWLPNIVKYNQHSIEFDNGSKILSYSSSSDNFRGYKINFIAIDDLVKKPSQEFMKCVFPTLVDPYSNLLWYSDLDKTEWQT